MLRSMVHLAFSKFVLERLERKNPGTPSEAEEISRANQKSEEAAVRYGYFQSEILKWEAKYKAECERTTKRRTQLMEMVEKTFYELKSISESTPEIHKWDCFISYPGGARELATRIFKEIDRHTRAFMDYFCLVAGQDWQRQLPKIQEQSDATVVVITRETSSAHFQISEIQRAINLKRSGLHRIVPVYGEPGVSTPFGLEQIHGVVAPPGRELDLPSLVLGHLSGIQ